MSASPPDPKDQSPAPDAWDHDEWKENDAWARDDWKNADWGKPAASSAKPSSAPRRGGLASYGKGMLEAGPYLSLGTQIAFGMALFVGMGYVVDRWLESRPWGMIFGAVLGLVAVFTLVVRMARVGDAKQREKRRS